MSAPPRKGASPDVLLVEDTASILMLYRTVLTKAGYPPICASSGAEALALFKQHRPGVVLLDMMLPDICGLEVMSQMLHCAPRTRVIVITANGSVGKAVEATRKGAYDFLVKPLGDVRLIGAVSSAIADSKVAAKLASGTAAQPHSADNVSFIAMCDRMSAVRTVMTAVARSMAPVFIHGASGTGKKTAARAIHAGSARARHPFIVFNCDSLSGHALEAALFGTGPQATDEASGALTCAIMQAQHGTLLLQAPESLEPEHQARLLCVLNNARLSHHPTDTPPVDIRIICASSRDPFDALRDGDLREDLFYRLFVLPLSMPALRERAQDIPALARQFLSEIAHFEGKAFTKITDDALDLLQHQRWDGNLHELRNVLRQAVVLHDSDTLSTAMLPLRVDVHATETQDRVDIGAALKGMTLAQIEEQVIRAAIARYDGSIPRAAQELDIAPSTIYRKRDGWPDPT